MHQPSNTVNQNSSSFIGLTNPTDDPQTLNHNSILNLGTLCVHLPNRFMIIFCVVSTNLFFGEKRFTAKVHRLRFYGCFEWHGDKEVCSQEIFDMRFVWISWASSHKRSGKILKNFFQFYGNRREVLSHHSLTHRQTWRSLIARQHKKHFVVKQNFDNDLTHLSWCSIPSKPSSRTLS